MPEKFAPYSTHLLEKFCIQKFCTKIFEWGEGGGGMRTISMQGSVGAGRAENRLTYRNGLLICFGWHPCSMSQSLSVSRSLHLDSVVDQCMQHTCYLSRECSRSCIRTCILCVSCVCLCVLISTQNIMHLHLLVF